MNLSNKTMPVKILMPALSPTMTEGNIAKWLKKQGDKVEPGQVIAEIETDKATMEVESVDSGVIAKILVSAGTHGVKVNQLIAVLREDGDDDAAIDKIIAEANDADAANSAQGTGAEVTDNTAADNSKKTNATNAKIAIDEKIGSLALNSSPSSIGDARGGETSGGRIFASPLAKRIAKDKAVDLREVHGSGPGGRIVRDDVLASVKNCSVSGKEVKDQTIPKICEQTSFTERTQPASSYEMTPVSNIRKVIAQRMVQSKQEVPHFYLSVTCEVSELLELRTQMNQRAGDRYKISVNDIIVKASAMAMRDVPETNASWSNDGMLYYNSVDVSVAVALDDGLITPIVKNADQKSLSTVSNEIKQLAGRAKAGKLRPEEFQGGSFTTSNLGMYGMESFFAIVNPPQSFILAIGAALDKPVIKNGELTIGKTLTITMSCDHRVIDGAVGARYCSALHGYLISPMTILV